MLPAIGRDGHVSLTIRDTKVAEEKIDSKQVAWGKPDAEGLTLGIYLLPRKAQYEIGDRVRLRFLVRNNGQQPVKTMWPGISVPMPDAFTVNDQTGAKVAVNIGHKNWDSPWTTLFKNEMLGVGEVHGLTVPYEISIGGGGSKNSLIGRVINARPGQKLQHSRFASTTAAHAKRARQRRSLAAFPSLSPKAPSTQMQASRLRTKIQIRRTTPARHGNHWSNSSQAS